MTPKTNWQEWQKTKLCGKCGYYYKPSAGPCPQCKSRLAQMPVAEKARKKPGKSLEAGQTVSWAQDHHAL